MLGLSNLVFFAIILLGDIMININERTKLAIELAKIAGKEIKRIHDEEDMQTKGKGLNDVVTIADIESEKIVK